MAVRIASVEPGSPAHRSGIRSGNYLVEINGQPVHDRLDAQYLLHDERVLLSIRNARGRLKRHEIEKAYEDDAGLRLPPLRPRTCRNHCIFCFVDQLPHGLRKSLYLKDEDYRLSFLQGSYVTLTDLKEGELDRIIQQRLSPLYISVHSTDQAIRRHMLGRKDVPDITGIIERLAQGRIEMHSQVVLCPGINDGEMLRQTVGDLVRYFPALRTVAVVPVGLTRHRRHLYPLKPVTIETARRLLDTIAGWQRAYRRTLGSVFVHAADEWYLLAGREIPAAESYGDFEQLENGVGMVRQFLDRFEGRYRHFPQSLSRPRAITIVTGRLAASFLGPTLVDRLSRIGNLTVHLRAIDNRLFGRSVTVSGLLTGGDIVNSLRAHPVQGTVLLPPNCLNEQGVFLDDLTPGDVAEQLGREVIVTDRHEPLRSLERVLA